MRHFRELPPQERNVRELPSQEPETPNMSTETAETILDLSTERLAHKNHFDIMYDQLVNPEGKQIEWRTGEQQRSLENMGIFLANTIGRYPGGERNANWNNKRQQLRAIGNFQTQTYQGVDGNEHMVRDLAIYSDGINIELQHVNNYHRLDERVGDRDKSDFVFFGVPGMTSREFDKPIRVYYQTDTAERPRAVWDVIEQTRAQTDRIPYGKFFYPGWSGSKRQRSDGILIMAYSQEELTAILNGISATENQLPRDYPETKRLVLGTPIANGVVRLAQQPKRRDSMEEVSFNDSRERLLQNAVHDVLGKQRIQSNEAKKAALEHIQANKPAFVDQLRDRIKKLSSQQDIHPHDFNFNADQDLGVIWQAVAESRLS